MVRDLEGKIALVTGAAQGQGAAHAEVLAKHGAKVVATDVLEAEGRALAERLDAEGLPVIFRRLDVSSAQDWKAVVDDVDAIWGPIDVLVNNAGIASRASVVDVSREEWDRTVAINQTGILLGMQAVLPGMQRRETGSIVNIASSWAHRGGAEDGHVAYVTSKAAVLGITRNAAMHLGPHGIRVNSVSPGYVRTPQIEQAERTEPDRVARDVAKIPMRRMARPVDIARTVAFLASDDSSYTTGVDFLVDGGLGLT